MKAAAVILALLPEACTQVAQPRLDAGVVLTPDGLRVYPSAGVRVGEVGVTVAR